MTSVLNRVMEVADKYNDIFRGEVGLTVELDSIFINAGRVWEIQEYQTDRGIRKDIVIAKEDEFTRAMFETHLEFLVEEIEKLISDKAKELFDDVDKFEIFMNIMHDINHYAGNREVSLILVKAQLAGTTGSVANANLNIETGELTSVMISTQISRIDLIFVACDVRTSLKHGVEYLLGYTPQK